MIDYKGKQEGEILMELVPHQCGDLNLMADNFDDDGEWNITDFIGKKLHLTVKVLGGRGLPQKLCNNVFVQFKFFMDTEPQKTSVCPYKTINPSFEDSFHIEQVRCGSLFACLLVRFTRFAVAY